MDLQTLRFDVSDAIATMTFARPEKRDALDLRMRREIAHVIGTVDLDVSIRALILVNSGGSFCSGGDIASQLTREPGADAGRKRMRDNWEWIQDLVGLDRPVIAAVDGPAVGAGFDIALARRFTEASPAALGLAKGILNSAFNVDLRTTLELEASANGICFETPYHRDAIERFVSKRPLRFRGFDREA